MKELLTEKKKYIRNSAMAVEEVNSNGKRKILVGLTFDSNTRELLDWAVVKFTDPGDCVVALHVCRNSGSTSKAQDLMDDYLAEYKVLCSQKQVELVAEVIKGNSIRKFLVRKAKCHAAAGVLVGTTKHSPLRGRVSIAKYCAKRLPLTTDIMAVHRGKIVYGRISAALQPGFQGDPKPSICLTGDQPSSEYQSEFGGSEISDMGRLSHDQLSQSPCSGCAEADRISKDEGSSLVEVERRRRSSLSSISLPVEDFTSQRPGWPLLQSACELSPMSLQARNMSVVNWVMNLPDRSLLHTEASSNKTLNSSCNGTSISVETLLPRDLEFLLETKTPDCTLFSQEMLKSSISQLSSEDLIGQGGCNCVYKGMLPDGKPAAVKFLKSSKESQKEFFREVEIMTTLKHKNITPLLGVCILDEDLISVYDFLGKGSLADNLHGNGKGIGVLPWEVRYNIALGIAEALNYLHNECPRPVIHRDIKSSNILLTDTFDAQLSDFGLAIWGPRKASFITDTDVVGTFGYLAPEYFMYGRVSDKVDVYSFGVVLLELLSGQKPIGLEASKGQESLVIWAKPMLETGDFEGILDEKLASNINKEEIQRMALAAKLCLTQASRLRPNMSQILKLLTGEKDLLGLGLKSEKPEDNDDEVYEYSSPKSHFDLALLDLDDNSTSINSPDQNSPLSVEEYLKRRWSRTSSLQ